MRYSFDVEDVRLCDEEDKSLYRRRREELVYPLGIDLGRSCHDFGANSSEG
jgi:hypothetical protein